MQAAVGIGVVLAALLSAIKAAGDVRVVALRERPDGRIEETEPPERLRGGDVTVLDVYGNLFYAGADTLQRRLPPPGKEPRPVVVLRMRGRATLGATAVDALAGYAERLRAVEGRLYLTGLSEQVLHHLAASGLGPEAGVHCYGATPVRGESTRQARTDAAAWLTSSQNADGNPQAGEPPDDDGDSRSG